MNDYENKRFKARLALVRYLISKSDQRNLTHGEKHHLHQVALSEIVQIEAELSGLSISMETQNSNIDPILVAQDISDIPF